MKVKTNWNMIEKAAGNPLNKLDNFKRVKDYLDNKPEHGFMRDPKNGKVIAIPDCTDGNLNRFRGYLNKLSNIAESKENKQIITEKLIEVSNEIQRRSR